MSSKVTLSCANKLETSSALLVDRSSANGWFWHICKLVLGSDEVNPKHWVHSTKTEAVPIRCACHGWLNSYRNRHRDDLRVLQLSSFPNSDMDASPFPLRYASVSATKRYSKCLSSHLDTTDMIVVQS